MDDGIVRGVADVMVTPSQGAQARLASLREQGGDRFDIAGWHYLDTLARQAAARKGTVRRLLEDKLDKAAAAFEQRLAQSRSAAAGVMATACAQHPHAALELQRLFAQYDFQGLRRLHATLDARAQCVPLAGLVAQLESAATASPSHSPVRPAPARATAASPRNLELKTVRESRSTWTRLSVDRQLSLAMKQAPKNAGPINSHMLVVRSLTLMQDISPDYLSRMVSYIDTLLFLDPGEKEEPPKRKKAVPAKAGKAIKSARK